MDSPKLHDVYFGLGTNLGNKEANIQQAIQNIEERIGKIIACSAFYITAPVGFDSANKFINAACLARTRLSPMEVLHIAKSIETEMGRKSKSVNGVYTDRIIDIDMLIYDSLILDSQELTLPHPHMHKRIFVMQPLADIAAEIIHPTLKMTIKDLLEKLNE